MEAANLRCRDDRFWKLKSKSRMYDYDSSYWICDLKWQGFDNSSLVTWRTVFSLNECSEICKFNLWKVTMFSFFSLGIPGISRNSRYPRNSRGSSKFCFIPRIWKSETNLDQCLPVSIVCHWGLRCGELKGLKGWHEVRGHPWVLTITLVLTWF